MELFEPFRNEPYSDFTQEGPQQAYRQALAEVRNQLGRDYPLIIGNKPLETGQWIVSSNPCAKDEVIGRAAKAQAAQIEPVMAAAYQGYHEWSGWSMAERARTLVKLAAIMRRRKLELAAWMTLEAGKNYAEAEADTAEAIDSLSTTPASRCA